MPIRSAPEPAQIRFARDIIGARQSHVPAQSLRLYAVEPAWTLTGALADHRLALRPELIGNVALEIARALGASVPQVVGPPEAEQFAKAAAADLIAQRGAALVLAGPRQPAQVHALCHWINNELAAPVDFIAPVDPLNAGNAESLRSLVADGHDGRIDTLIVIGANPVYDAPGELALADIIGATPVHRASWRVSRRNRGALHLASAADACAGGLVGYPRLRRHRKHHPAADPPALRQPHAPTKCWRCSTTPAALQPTTWSAANGSRTAPPAASFDAWWRQTLQDGVVADTAIDKDRAAAIRGCRKSRR